ncbi:protein arginine kinase [Streptohalobacillus salinus]|uniref:Protein-arginine kinase n=1 Tax=Streptohalobacillus salinus TaxID=621096 RepID=A0A2V3W3N7_9BACI|nr:protein arginine kinase [Streptohalobacillus salinus]PXW87748.1 protein arginine kinase [Streptohalobacillus salinus]
MSLQSFINEAISPWMQEKGPDDDIVLSTRIRLARNFRAYPFPIKATSEQQQAILDELEMHFSAGSKGAYQALDFINLTELTRNEQQILVEKHLVSPYLIEQNQLSGILLSKNEQLSIMINEEDHLRTQLYFPGFQLEYALKEAFRVDDWLEEQIDYAFDERRGYLTSCPTNVGTGLRASVMVHLPALTLTKKLAKMIPAINQFGLVVRGIYGEGTEALGNIYQVSNQVTLGRTEEDIIENLTSVVRKLIEHEREVRQVLVNESERRLEDRIFRSYGVLKHSRIIESKEAAACLSDLRLGIDVGFLEDIPTSILNELMVLTQPAYLQHYYNSRLKSTERDIKRASLIRERLRF